MKPSDVFPITEIEPVTDALLDEADRVVGELAEHRRRSHAACAASRAIQSQSLQPSQDFGTPGQTSGFSPSGSLGLRLVGSVFHDGSLLSIRVSLYRILRLYRLDFHNDGGVKFLIFHKPQQVQGVGMIKKFH